MDLKDAVLKSLGSDAETRLRDAFLSGEVLNVAGMMVRVVSRTISFDTKRAGDYEPTVYEFALEV